ncbi:MAG: choice-of-anchor Q domain-containing protein [Thermomicrobiales bacterium]
MPICLTLRRFAMVIAGLLALGLALAIVSVRAAGTTYTVTTTDDTPTNANCAVSCTLRQAINASNVNDPGPGNQNSIQFAASVSGTITLVNDGAHGTLAVSKSVAITASANGPGIVVDGNHAVEGFSIGVGVVANIRYVTIANGATTFGGGIYNHGTLTLENVTLRGNAASNFGGAIYSDTSGALTITNVTVSANSAHVGGGIAIANGALTLTNTTISGNTARFSQGGGIYIGAGTATLTNTIVAANVDTTTGNPPDDINGTVVSGSKNNLIGPGGSGGLVNGTNSNLVGVANPLLGALGTYGSANGTETLPLLPGSPAINAGDDATCAQTTGIAPVGGKDQRGVIRPQRTHCDIGAYEALPIPGPLPPPQPTAPPGGPPSPLPPVQRPTAPPTASTPAPLPGSRP